MNDAVRATIHAHAHASKSIKWTRAGSGSSILVVAGRPGGRRHPPVHRPARPGPLTDRRFEPTQARLERGKYLVTSGPGAVRAVPLAVGHDRRRLRRSTAGRSSPAGTGRRTARPFVTAPNLTPDPETGIGKLHRRRAGARDPGRHRPRRPHPVPDHAVRRTSASMPDEDLASIDRLPAIAEAGPQSAAGLRGAVPAQPPDQRRARADRRAGHGGPLDAGEARRAHRRRSPSAATAIRRGTTSGNASAGHRRSPAARRMPFEGRKTIYTANITPARQRHPVLHRGSLHRSRCGPARCKARQLDPMMPTRATTGT